MPSIPAGALPAGPQAPVLGRQGQPGRHRPRRWNARRRGRRSDRGAFHAIMRGHGRRPQPRAPPMSATSQRHTARRARRSAAPTVSTGSAEAAPVRFSPAAARSTHGRNHSAASPASTPAGAASIARSPNQSAGCARNRRSADARPTSDGAQPGYRRSTRRACRSVIGHRPAEPERAPADDSTNRNPQPRAVRQRVAPPTAARQAITPRQVRQRQLNGRIARPSIRPQRPRPGQRQRTHRRRRQRRRVARPYTDHRPVPTGTGPTGSATSHTDTTNPSVLTTGTSATTTAASPDGRTAGALFSLMLTPRVWFPTHTPRRRRPNIQTAAAAPRASAPRARRIGRARIRTRTDAGRPLQPDQLVDQGRRHARSPRYLARMFTGRNPAEDRRVPRFAFPPPRRSFLWFDLRTRPRPAAVEPRPPRNVLARQARQVRPLAAGPAHRVPVRSLNHSRPALELAQLSRPLSDLVRPNHGRHSRSANRQRGSRDRRAGRFQPRHRPARFPPRHKRPSTAGSAELGRRWPRRWNARCACFSRGERVALPAATFCSFDCVFQDRDPARRLRQAGGSS